MILLLIKEAQDIVGLKNHRHYLYHSFPECALSSTVSLGDKGNVRGEKDFYVQRYSGNTGETKRNKCFHCSIFGACHGHCQHCHSKAFQTYFVMKSLYMIYLTRLSFSEPSLGNADIVESWIFTDEETET